jgi:hypothetical protein
MNKKGVKNMKKILILLFAALQSVIFSVAAFATPSTVYWSPCTTYFQPFGKGHIGYDSYVRPNSALSNDYGFTVGVLPFKEINAEVGYDALLPQAPLTADSKDAKNASYVNAKIGTPEDGIIPVGIAVGIFNAGFVKDVTDYDVIYGVIQKTINNIGTFAVGGYTGNKKLLLNETGDADNKGIMLGYTSPQVGKFIFAADYMSGKNALGAWGGGVYTYFADNVTLLTGPVFPNANTYLAGSKEMVWTLQLDIDFDIIPPAPAAK